MSYPTIANPRRAQALRQAREARMAAKRAMDYLALKRKMAAAFDRWAAATPAAANAAETEYRALVQQTRELMSR